MSQEMNILKSIEKIQLGYSINRIRLLHISNTFKVNFHVQFSARHLKMIIKAAVNKNPFPHI